MNATILCTLLAQRIPPEQFQFWGLDIHWMSEEYNTEANNAIVADVIANYDVLAAALEIEQRSIKKRNAYKAETDPIYAEWQALLAVGHKDAETRRLEWVAKREEIQAQVDKYIADCLAVKAKYSKE